MNSAQKFFTFKVWAGSLVGKVLALLRACSVNGAAFCNFAIDQEDAGTIFFNLKGIPPFYILFSYLTISHAEMPSNPIYIYPCNKEDRAG